MDRTEALAYLINEFSQQLVDTGMVPTDSIDGFGPAIDSALRQVGFTRAEFATAEVLDGDEEKFEVMLEYFALKRFSKLLAQNINIGVNGKNFSLQQAFANVKSLLDAATKAAEMYGLGSNGGIGDDDFGFVNLNLGILARAEDDCLAGW